MSPVAFSKFVWQEAVRCCTNIPVAQRLVILHIGATADLKGRNAWRANNRVVAELGVSPDTVKRARNAAIKHGLMVVTRAAPRGAGNTKTAEYQLTLPAGVQAVDSRVIGGSTAPISAGEIGAAEAGNRCKTTPEIGAAECHPSVTFGSFFGGKRPPEDPRGIEDAPDPLPGNATGPATATWWVMSTYGPRCRSHVDDPNPPKCGGCRDARNAAAAEAEAAHAARTADLAAIRSEIDACTRCDRNGLTHGDKPRRCTEHRQLADARPAA